MSNPAVMLLASLSEISEFPYRFDIEDNVGEAIHIHYKDIRLDLTISEFEALANTLKDVFVQLVENSKFHIEDYDAGNLVWLAESLLSLEDVVEDEMYLEDILVDTYDANGDIQYKSLTQSRVLKALDGNTSENDMRKQINYYQVMGSKRQTNQERLEYDLEQIKQYGYPRNTELILLRHDNTIIDGQHRAACLYFLYGNIRVPVRKLYFRNQDEKQTITVNAVEHLREERDILRQKLYALEQQYHQLDIVLNQKDGIVKNYQEELLALEQRYHQLDIALNQKDGIIKNYQEQNMKLEQDVRRLDNIINEKDDIIKNAQEEIKQLEKYKDEYINIQESISWKITKLIRILLKESKQE